jgi:hypothetical protein
MEGPAGSRTIIEGGASSWTGPWDDPYRAPYAFTVTNEGATTETITTYTFLVPRECLNLAFLGRTEEQRPGKRETCSERRTAPLPPLSTCDKLVLDKTEAHRGDVVSYQVTGKWVELELEVLLDGEKLPDVRLTGESGTLPLTRQGTYTIVATTTDELGEKTSSPACQASVQVVAAEPVITPSPTRTPIANLPSFPWPPPEPSSRTVLPDTLFRAEKTFGEVAKKLERALKRRHYAEYSYYSIPGGFALITRLERIHDDGLPYDSSQRWDVANHFPPLFTLENYLKALFSAREGYYRVIAFLVTDVPFGAGPKSMSHTMADDLLAKGFNTLPRRMRLTALPEGHTCTALVYEFRRLRGGEPRQMTPGLLDARTHLVAGGLWAELGLH